MGGGPPGSRTGTKRGSAKKRNREHELHMLTPSNYGPAIINNYYVMRYN